MWTTVIWADNTRKSGKDNSAYRYVDENKVIHSLKLQKVLSTTVHRKFTGNS